MIKTLIPFLVYWGVLVLGCILFFVCPLLFFIMLPTLLVIVPVWFIVVYLIGNMVQQKSRLEGIGKRIILAFLCSALTIMIFPVGSGIYDILQWNKLHLISFINGFKDMFLWGVFAVHFLIFWIGEEVGHVATKGNEDLQKKIL